MPAILRETNPILRLYLINVDPPYRDISPQQPPKPAEFIIGQFKGPHEFDGRLKVLRGWVEVTRMVKALRDSLLHDCRGGSTCLVIIKINSVKPNGVGCKRHFVFSMTVFTGIED